MTALTSQTSLANVNVIPKHYFGDFVEKLRELYNNNAPKVLGAE